MDSLYDLVAEATKKTAVPVSDPPGGTSDTAVSSPLDLSHLTTKQRQQAVAFGAESAQLITDQTTELSTPPQTRLPSQSYCCKSAVIGSAPDRSHVVVIPVPCKSWDCPKCGPKKRKLWLEKLASGQPERELTLTCPKGKFGNAVNTALVMKKAWTKLVQRIRRNFGYFEYALVWELTHAGTPHIHVLFRGSYIPKKWISDQWTSLGIGFITYIQSVKSFGLHAAHACKYLAKATGQTAVELAPLRIVQVSREYLPPPGPDTLPEKYEGFVWVHDRRLPSEIVESFLRSQRYFDVEHHEDGSVEIFLLPDVPPERWRAATWLWVAGPESFW